MPYFQIRGFAPPGVLESLSVPKRGPCSLCRTYQKAYSRKRLADELRLFGLMLNRTEGSAPGALVMVSGGKDSLSALFVAKETLKWNVSAFLFDNGFIPKAVVEQTRQICERLRVPLHVETMLLAEKRAFAHLVASVTPDGATPCDLCAHGMNDAIARLAQRSGFSQVILGTNFYASWGSYPSALSQVPNPLTGQPLQYLNLPYAVGITSAQTRANVKQLGARIIEMKGVSTNCRVPEIVQRRIGRELGHIPELEVMSLEVMVGHLPRAEALRTLRAKATPAA
jgi:PP-loop superfamily ATP-utilizing enzyme